MEIVVATAYFAPISYYAHLLRAKKVYVEQFETFQKQTYRNRCKILAANGVLALSIPLSERRNNSLTKDIKISHETSWQSIHWKSISSAYNSSPFFEYYADELIPSFERQTKFLIDYNLELQNVVQSLLKISVPFSKTSEYQKEITEALDLRNSFSPKKENNLGFPTYSQVFDLEFGFQKNLSILDLLFNLGPDSRAYLDNISL